MVIFDSANNPARDEDALRPESESCRPLGDRQYRRETKSICDAEYFLRAAATRSEMQVFARDLSQIQREIGHRVLRRLHRSDSRHPRVRFQRRGGRNSSSFVASAQTIHYLFAWDRRYDTVFNFFIAPLRLFNPHRVNAFLRFL